MRDRFRRGGRDPQETTRKRFVRRQWTRRWLTLRYVLAAVTAVLLIVGSVWLVFFSSVLAVKGADVEGARLLSDAQVKEAADVPTGTPLARADIDAMTDNLEELPEVATADVSRMWPDKVLIKLRERVAVATVTAGGKFRGMDETGVVFREFKARPKALPWIKVDPATDAQARDEVLAEGAAVVSALPRHVARRVGHVEVTSIDQISLHLRDGRTVVWGSADQSADKGKVLAVLLEQDARVYDVSVPGQPTTR